MYHYRLIFNDKLDDWQLYYRGCLLSNGEVNRLYNEISRSLLNDTTFYHLKFASYSLVKLLLRIGGNVPTQHLKVIEFDSSFHIAFVYNG